MIYFFLTIAFFGISLLYFKIADHYNIIDHPNERSSHVDITIRGGGVVFLFAAAAAFILHPLYWLPLTGIIVIGVISFLDDRIMLSNIIRLLFHLISVTMLFLFLNVFTIFRFYEILLLYFFAVGTINAYNFMDGINGITGAYSLVVLSGLQYINLFKVKFVNSDLIWLPIIACCVFLFFNFRKKAKCFAGDVGSVSVAFWVIILLLKLILLTNNWVYLLFLAVYGVDSVLTILHRLLLKQDVFKAHRFHFYQLLVNEQQLPHLNVAASYALLQAVIIVAIIINIKISVVILYLLTIMPLTIIYILVKPRLQRSKQKLI